MNEPKQPTVLIVDDIPSNLRTLGDYLIACGLEVLFAVDGKGALEHCRYDPPDIILLDVLMPGWDGFETCRQLKQDPVTTHIPVIFITALSQSEDRVKGLEVGGVDFVTKPLDQEEVLARIRTHLLLESQRRALQELNATKDKFFSIISHDLKGAFNGLIAGTDLMRQSFESLDDEVVKSLMEGLYVSAKNAFNLLENLLQWSRSQTGRLECTPRVIDLAELAARVVHLLESSAKSKGIRLNNHIQEQVLGYADEEMIQTVLRNLVSNAIKYCNPGDQVDIHCQRTKDWLEVSVADTGVGISPKRLERLFRIDFYQASPGTAKEQGTGLGLILCKEFVEKNHGRIWATSHPGEKTVFRFTLPAHDA